MRRIPTLTERHDDAPAIDLYTAMLRRRIVFVADPLDDTVAIDVAAALLHLDAERPERPISLYLNASAARPPGDQRQTAGETLSGMMIVYDAMTSVGCDVQTVCMGRASTAVAVLLAAGSPGTRLVAPSARIVLDEPVIGPATGRADDIAIRAADAHRAREAMVDLLARHTGKPRGRIDGDLRRTVILTASEAVDYGLADHPVAARAART